MKESTAQTQSNWIACEDCHGRGKKRRKLAKKTRLHYQRQLELFEKSGGQVPLPIRPRGHLYTCPSCEGTGIVSTDNPPTADSSTYPHVAIIGGGIGGAALAVACLHRKIPFTLYERDLNFDARSQGYGLTLQQASKAIRGLGVILDDQGVISIRHLVHTTSGRVVGQWGGGIPVLRPEGSSIKRSNIHIARQSLRLSILAQLEQNDSLQWGHQLLDFKQNDTSGIEMSFLVNGEIKRAHADLVVGADGIRSTVRKQVISEDSSPLRYLDCMVILGICPLAGLNHTDSDLLDSATVFQTANGNDRLYVMPYTVDSIMWQLSFPISEADALDLSAKGRKALKEEACLRTPWHAPIPQLMAATPEDKISGYPVYDRELLHTEQFDHIGDVTLLGDAAHPMSPFKGQGANQAILDALSLAQIIAKECPFSPWKTLGLRKTILKEFEKEMLSRSASKVKGSADAAQFLHSDIVLQEGNEPRGRCRTKF
ncbi:FAD-dependent oxidoreductase [Sphingobacterium tabacisoli]|uniref:FAD-dependent oxidoreductase n=1 Tax=Sphingobacterium tabacisoli TaxID=2044855 RepID=A0ABW5L093_9SPHI|nr:NAD(P)/FAD-dependent oxidoreductase [Sphingobacterium tabacisoli]